MALPNLPAQGQNPWYLDRENFDQSLRTELEGRLSAAGLDSSITSGVEKLGVYEHRIMGTRAQLQSAIDRAVTAQVPLYLSGNYSIDSQLNLPSGTRIIGMHGVRIAMTSNLTPHMVITAANDVEVSSLTLVGKTTDYVNNDTVYGATAIRVVGACNRVTVSNVVVEAIAGAGVFVQTGTAKNITVRGCFITGIGKAVLGSAQYSAGIVMQDGIQDISILNCDISEIAQGVAIGHGSNRTLFCSNRVHHTSEHGAYFATSSNYTITDNVFYETGLLGFKIQNGKAGYTCKSAVITGNTVYNTGSTAIMITNAIDSVKFIENVVISSNVIYGCGDTGFRIDNARFVKISDNIVNGSRFGIRLISSEYVEVADCTIVETERTGFLIDGCIGVSSRGLTMWNAGVVGPEKVGVIVQGVVSDLLIEGSFVDYNKAAQSDGLLFGTGTYSNIQLRNNHFRGANWGMRTSTASSAITVWRNNYALGSIGTVDGAPALMPLLPDTTGSTLANLEIEVNKVKSLMRAQKDAR